MPVSGSSKHSPWREKQANDQKTIITAILYTESTRQEHRTPPGMQGMEEVKLELKRKYLLTGLGGKEERGR